MWTIVSYITYPITYWFEDEEEEKKVSLTPHSFAPLPKDKVIVPPQPHIY